MRAAWGGGGPYQNTSAMIARLMQAQRFWRGHSIGKHRPHQLIIAAPERVPAHIATRFTSGRRRRLGCAPRRTARQRRALDADVEVDDAVVVDVDFTVVVEVAVEISGDAQGDVEVDPAVVVDV